MSLRRGGDSRDGSNSQPFATLERAKMAVRDSGEKTATIWIGGGTYHLVKPFDLTAEDSGTPEKPAVYRAVEGETPRLSGGIALTAGDFKPVTDKASLDRVAAPARGKIVEFDLAARGVKHTGPYPDVFTDTGGIVDLICDGKRMPLLRFPNKGYMTMGKVLYTAGGPQGDWASQTNNQKVARGSTGGIFKYREEFQRKHALWQKQLHRGVWFQGYGRVAWENPAIRVLAIDPAARTVTFAKPISNGSGNKYTRPARNGRESYWTHNLLEEIDQPGEWSVDLEDYKLYFYPPEGFQKTGAALMDRREPVVSLNGASHVTLCGLSIESNLGDGIRVTGGEGDLIAGCVVRNTDKYAVVLDGGKNHSVVSCDLYHLGAGGVWLGGGDEKSIPSVPAGHRVVNNHIHHFAEIERVYAPGVNCGFTGGGGGGHHTAVGMLVAHNLIHDTPHGGVLFGSMDSVFEYNEIFSYCLVSNDLGAFYSFDRYPQHFGGHTFRYNLMHSSAIGDGIYFDFDHSNMKLYGNIACLGSTSKRGTGFLYKKGEFEKSPQDIECWNNIAINCNTGFEFVSILPNKGRIDNNIVVNCRTPIDWREIKDG
jgi:hypothetical protein